MSMPSYKPLIQTFKFGPWTITETKSHILTSEGPARETFESSLRIPSFPEMIFDQNSLKIEYEGGVGIEFNARDALDKVDPENYSVKVSNSDEWMQARAESEHISRILKPFDWTFTTDYKGTLLSQNDAVQFEIQETTEKINLQKLQAKDKIHFYTDLVLFEDELHDNGCSILSVKMRVMPNFFFVLLRQFMRVDNVLIRINDTRLFHEAGSDFVLREQTLRESPFSELNVPDHLLTNPNEIWDKVKIKSEHVEKLMLPTLSPTPMPPMENEKKES
ncbi:hypothetical protein CAPTEDRAFT_149664 [Capitella teleta]|uniref:TIP41-like protein n=1 Tax=Capitella teleta TaxID=283909 RepID=R7TW14_CAPTE|nr:hypothetical protein CAPTEDRAFT_149664 [Capitella teleta]|eukprot:ELT97899.1 hypothetical protein CAPTEDRAFT_149664 [Capitella teleta]